MRTGHAMPGFMRGRLYHSRNASPVVRNFDVAGCVAARGRMRRAQRGEQILRFFPFLVDPLAWVTILQAGGPNAAMRGEFVEKPQHSYQPSGAELVMKKLLLAFAVALVVSSQCFAAILTPLTSFGGGDGWRAPKEVVAGDAAGTTTSGNYTYLDTGNGERGIAYNPVTGNLLLVSRPSPGAAVAVGAAPFVRVLNGATGADLGGFNMTGVSGGGGGLLNKIGTTTDGVIYAANIATSPAGAGPLRVYRWGSEASGLTTGGNTAPTLFSGAAIAGTTRLGDTMDVMGPDANVSLVFGNVNGNGYVTLNSSATASVIGTITPNTSPTGPGANAFGRAITFAADSSQVWGKGTDNTQQLYRTTITSSTAATRDGVITFTLANSGQTPMDYAVIQGVPYLAMVDYLAVAGTTSSTNRPNVFIYDMSDPTNPLLVASGSTVPTGISITAAAGAGAIATAGGAGHVAWGGSSVVGSDLVTSLYAMATNQGIQAFNFSVPLLVPEAGAFASVGLVALLSWGFTGIRRRRDVAVENAN